MSTANGKPSRSRKVRGAATQAAVAGWFAGHGWPFAESTGSARQGVDVTGLPGLACEVKARRELRLPAWLKQAAARPGVAFVVHRPDGYGPEKIAGWPVTIRLDEFTKLLHAAGYGDVPARPAQTVTDSRYTSGDSTNGEEQT